MQRVKSDDLNADDEECPKEDKKEEKISSPIGAGLPLLQRLRLLKEKQVRFRCLPCYVLLFFFFFSLAMVFVSHPSLIIFLIFVYFRYPKLITLNCFAFELFFSKKL
jgi:hypothetical protein